MMPTGLGKTVVAALAIAERLAMHPDSKAVVVAPTRPLVLQHARYLRDTLSFAGGQTVALTGHEPPAKRQRLFRQARVVASTPQGLVEDVDAGRIVLNDVALLVVDEAHRAVGEYAYVGLLQKYRAQATAGRVLGLTASPGGQTARIRRVVANLGGVAVEAVQEDDEEVAEYVSDTDVEWRWVDLPPPLRAWRDALAGVFQDRLAKLKPFLRRSQAWHQVPKTQLLRIGEAVRARLGKAGRGRGFLFAALLHQGAAVEANHCMELLETQGVAPLRDYLERLSGAQDATRSQRSFLKDERVNRLVLELDPLRGPGLEHPKEKALVEVVRDQLARKPEGRVLVFAQYRDTVRRLVRVLAEGGVAAERFVGQADRDGDDGLGQAEQADLLARFASGGVRVLVATSVAEEGLHVPDVDLVVFQEPLVSEIRTIQRRGRTGRTGAGRVVVLACRGTRDERHARVEATREQTMRRIVGDLHEATHATTPAVPP